MDRYRRTVLVDIEVGIDEGLRESVRSFLGALEYVQALYHLEKACEPPLTLENAIFQRIIQTLKSGVAPLSYEDRADLERRIELMARGIYDLSSITLRHEGKDHIDLILGKVFSLEGDSRRFYSGAVGVVNGSFNDLIEDYDTRLGSLLERLPVPGGKKGLSIREKLPLMRCIDVFSLAGELDTRHKPICVFFSGGGPENLSTLSRVTVFINLYVRRFELISREIARRYIMGHSIIEGLDYETIGRFLLLWLRGHDIGHFCGEDSLSRYMSEMDRVYLILHELKSDMVALYGLKYVVKDLLKGVEDPLVKAYLVSIAEMFRYIRRGGFYNHPDTASAFLAYSHLKENGSIGFDPIEGRFKVDFDRLERGIEDLTEEVFGIFAEGSVSRARELVNRWGDISRLGQSDLPGELKALEDASIPHYIDFNFVTRDRILSGPG